MQEGLYKALFQTQQGAGAGVVYLSEGTVRGGDSGMFYVGTYTLDGDQFTATVKVDTHTDTPGLLSTLGRDSATLVLAGSFNGDTVITKGTTPDVPGLTFQAILSRLSD
ncbi:GrlR family regulatory protein [Roseibium album]|uniref:GrlR family regulatory protein n=1 Tax=Roseibium album TaxID=311410 RepID=UPI00329A6637